jgi:hypothetical protein
MIVCRRGCEWRELTLTGFAAGLHLVDDVNAAFAADDAAIAVSFLEAFQRVHDFHGFNNPINIYKSSRTLTF